MLSRISRPVTSSRATRELSRLTTVHQRIAESETGTQLTVAEHPLGHGGMNVLGIADQHRPQR